MFSRRFVKSFPVLSGGFEIETELTIHALELGLAVDEIVTPYCARPMGSISKLNTWRDGFRILLTIFNIYRAERPLTFYTELGAAAAASSFALAIPLVVTCLETGLVPRLPTAVLSTGLMLSALLCIAVGLVLDYGDPGPSRNKAAGLSFHIVRRVRTPAGLNLSPIRRALRYAHIGRHLLIATYTLRTGMEATMRITGDDRRACDEFSASARPYSSSAASTMSLAPPRTRGDRQLGLGQGSHGVDQSLCARSASRLNQRSASVQAGAKVILRTLAVANCHGAPGANWAKFSEGLHPDPPDLEGGRWSQLPVPIVLGDQEWH